MLLVSGVDEGLEDVVHVLSRLPAFLNHLEENLLDLSVRAVPFSEKEIRPALSDLLERWTFSELPSAVLPEAGQGQPARQEPGSVGESSIQVGIQLGHSLIQHAADLLPMKAAAGCQDDQLRQGLKQVWEKKIHALTPDLFSSTLSCMFDQLLLSPLSPHLWKYCLVSASMIFTCSLKRAMFRPVFSIFFCSRNTCDITKKTCVTHRIICFPSDVFCQKLLSSVCSHVISPIRCTHRVWNIIGNSFAKHRSGQPGVDVLGVQVLVLAVEHQRGCFAAQQVGECAPYHGETEHRTVLWAVSITYYEEWQAYKWTADMWQSDSCPHVNYHIICLIFKSLKAPSDMY